MSHTACGAKPASRRSPPRHRRCSAPGREALLTAGKGRTPDQPGGRTRRHPAALVIIWLREGITVLKTSWSRRVRLVAPAPAAPSSRHQQPAADDGVAPGSYTELHGAGNVR